MEPVKVSGVMIERCDGGNWRMCFRKEGKQRSVGGRDVGRKTRKGEEMEEVDEENRNRIRKRQECNGDCTGFGGCGSKRIPGSTWTNRKRREEVYFEFAHSKEPMRREEMEEQFSTNEDKQGWRLADAARVTDEKASSEDRKHRCEEVFVAIDSNLGAMVNRSRRRHVQPWE